MNWKNILYKFHKILSSLNSIGVILDYSQTT